MIMYLATMGFIGWLIPKLIVTRWKGWGIVALAILARWTGGIMTGIGIVAIEISSLGVQAAVERFATALIVPLIVSVWTAIANRKQA